jgi:hypothetical protein
MLLGIAPEPYPPALPGFQLAAGKPGGTAPGWLAFAACRAPAAGRHACTPAR